jgi:hypothetical protein
MKQVVNKSIAQIFSAVNGNTIISMDTETVPVLKGGKSNPLQGRVTKVMRGASVMVFQNKNSNGYENMVKRRLAKEGKDVEFNVGPRAWGTRVEGTPIVEHKGKTYLEVIFLRAGEVEYRLDGKVIDAEVVGEQTSSNGQQAGLDNKVVIRTFAEDSIKRLKVGGVIFEA